MADINISINTHFRGVQDFLNDFLADSLPNICSGSSDWWTIMVRGARIKGSQKNRIRSGSIIGLKDLDLVSLCSLLSYHWEALARHRQIEDLQNEVGILCDSIINLRNRLSHEGSGNRLDSEEELHALLGLGRFCMLLGAPQSLIQAISQDKARLMLDLAGMSSFDKSVSDISATGLNPDDNLDWSSSGTEERGMPLDVLSVKGDEGCELQAALSIYTFIGIDFGTSTTVVSRVYLDPNSKVLVTQPIPIPQIDRLGRTHEQILVPSCIS
jgi:hypothetical protein